MTDQISFTILLFSKEKDIEIHWKKDMESQLYFLCVYLIHRYPCWLNSTSLKKKKRHSRWFLLSRQSSFISRLIHSILTQQNVCILPLDFSHPHHSTPMARLTGIWGAGGANWPELKSCLQTHTSGQEADIKTSYLPPPMLLAILWITLQFFISWDTGKINATLSACVWCLCPMGLQGRISHVRPCPWSLPGDVIWTHKVSAIGFKVTAVLDSFEGCFACGVVPQHNHRVPYFLED